MSERDRLVSTALLRERRARLREQIAEQKKQRADGDPFFKIAEWLLAEWEQAERDAAKEYVSTAEASRLTGWSVHTLRLKAQRARTGVAMGEGWEGLQARRTGGKKGDWTFVLSTIPAKRTAAA